jgi:hypothetical protein
MVWRVCQHGQVRALLLLLSRIAVVTSVVLQDPMLHLIDRRSTARLLTDRPRRRLLSAVEQ